MFCRDATQMLKKEEEKHTEQKDHISFSELSDWEICALYHKLKWLDKLQVWQDTVFTIFGTCLHASAERLVLEEFISRTEKKIWNYKRQETEELFQKQFQESIKSWLTETNREPDEKEKKLIIDMWTFQGPKILPNIIDSLKIMFGLDYEVIGTEKLLMETIEEGKTKKFKGLIDLVLRTHDGRYHIIDWKTCSWGWDSKQKTSRQKTYQLTFYKHFLAQSMGIPQDQIDCYFALMKRTAKEKSNIEIFKVPVGKVKIKNALALLKKANANIEKKNFLKNLSGCDKHYGRCPFEGTEHCKKRF